MTHTPHTVRLPGQGWLRNGGRPGNPGNAPRCGAKTRKGTPCRSPAMPNGRCRMHGGPSTGAKTAEGIERIRAARTKHGRYSAASIARRRAARQAIRALRELLRSATATEDEVLDLMARLR
jgi:hypothetical protein